MIYQCKDEDFLTNCNEIGSFIYATKNAFQINNSDRLIKLLNIYFSTLIYYKNHVKGKYQVEIKNKVFEVKFEGTNLKGEHQALDIIEAENSIINNILSFLLNSMNIHEYEILQKTYISIFETEAIDLIAKVNFLNADHILFNNVNDQFLFRIDENVAFNSISERIKILYSLFGDKEAQNQIENFDSTYEILERYLKLYLRNCIFRNNFASGLVFLKAELERYNGIDADVILNDNKIVFCLLTNIISYNNLFQISPKEKIKEIVDDYAEFLDDKNLEIVYSNLNFNPNNFTLDNLNIGIANPDFSKVETNKILTRISFVIQIDQELQDFKISNGENIIEFKKVNNLFDDPIFAFYNALGFEINGMPLTIFSDSIGSIYNSYLIEFILPFFYHPDFEIKGKDVIYLDFTLEKAQHGGKYYPYKDFILAELISIVEKNILPFEFKKDQLNSNLISNFFISYDLQNEVIHHQAYTITNFDSYFKAKNKYFENINKFEFDKTSDLSDFILNTVILNHNQFFRFCISLIEKTIKKSIELGGLHKNMWMYVDHLRSPIKEVDAQRLIFNQVRYIAEMKGISISRECVSANGSVDFFFQYTKNDKLFRVCVELKNAHHEKADEGNYKQLTEYIRDIGYKYGIYIILWYKGSDFQKPNKYSSKEELEHKLNNNPIVDFKIENILIDCSYNKVSPSKN